MSEAVQPDPADGTAVASDDWGYDPEADAIPLTTGSRASWNDAVSDLRSYINEKRDQRLLFTGDGGDEVRAAPYSHRFRASYQRWQYSRLNSLSRGLVARWAGGQATLLTFTVSTTDSNGDPRPPVDVLNELREAWGHTRRELSRVMNGERVRDPEALEWEYLKILEGTTNRGEVIGGYVHLHVAVFTEHPVPKSRFRPVMEKHVDKAPNARMAAHRLDGNAISQSSFQNIDALGAYLHAYTGNDWGDPSPGQERFLATLHATGARQFSMSEGCREAIKAGDTRPEREWGPLQAERPTEWTFQGCHHVSITDRVESFESVRDLEIATGMELPTFLSGVTGRETNSGIYIGESVGVTEEGAYLVGEFPDRFVTYDWPIVVAHLTNKQDGDIIEPPRGRPPPTDR